VLAAVCVTLLSALLSPAVSAVGAPTGSTDSSALIVDVSTLKGKHFQGTLKQLSAVSLVIAGKKGEQRISLADILDVRISASAQPAAVATGPIVVLNDGSRIGCRAVVTSARTVTLETQRIGRVSVPLADVAHIRFAPADSRVDAAWRKLTARKSKRDMLIVRKKNVLDHLDGVVGIVDEKFVRFLLSGNEIPVKRERVFGVIYTRPQAIMRKAFCRITLVGDDRLDVSRVTLDSGRFQARLRSGRTVQIAPQSVRRLDFSAGKVQYLSAMEPRDVRYTPVFDEDFRYQRDHTWERKPLRVGGKTYTRGLWIHSKTSLRYRLAGAFRRFQAVMGIDDDVRGRGGDVHVVIRGDGKTLFGSDVKDGDKPRTLDLDVRGVRDLEILVDFAGPQDAGTADHLDLADARVTK